MDFLPQIGGIQPGCPCPTSKPVPLLPRCARFFSSPEKGRTPAWRLPLVSTPGFLLPIYLHKKSVPVHQFEYRFHPGILPISRWKHLHSVIELRSGFPQGNQVLL